MSVLTLATDLVTDETEVVNERLARRLSYRSLTQAGHSSSSANIGYWQRLEINSAPH